MGGRRGRFRSIELVDGLAPGEGLRSRSGSPVRATSAFKVGLPNRVSRVSHSLRPVKAGNLAPRRPTSGRSARRSIVSVSPGKRLVPRHFE